MCTQYWTIFFTVYIWNSNWNERDNSCLHALSQIYQMYHPQVAYREQQVANVIVHNSIRIMYPTRQEISSVFWCHYFELVDWICAALEIFQAKNSNGGSN